MPSMSYCMFENTLRELHQIDDEMAEHEEMTLDAFITQLGNEHERRSAKQLIELCRQIVDRADNMKENN